MKRQKSLIMPKGFRASGVASGIKGDINVDIDALKTLMHMLSDGPQPVLPSWVTLARPPATYDPPAVRASPVC